MNVSVVAYSRRATAINELRSSFPLRWFLPGAIRIRGGRARDFASDWIPHRGIHPEATCGNA